MKKLASKAMLHSIDLLGEVHSTSDHQLLRAYLWQLVDQPFLCFRFAYGDELTLHFGNPRNYESRRLKHLAKGSYIVSARASSWFLRVEKPPSIIVSNGSSSLPNGTKALTKQDLEASNFVNQGARILAAVPIPTASAAQSPNGFALSLLMSDGSALFIYPNPDEPQQPDDIADWQVFTPHDRCLEVGPGLQWSYVDTQRPV